MSGFIGRHTLWSDAQTQAAETLVSEMRHRDLEAVRLAFADQHGLLRGKMLSLPAFLHALEEGHGAPSSLVLKDPSNRTVYPVFRPGALADYPQFTGVADLVMVPDPTTFRVLPWAPHTGWILCDLFFPDGTALPFSTRNWYRRVLDRLEQMGFDHLVGLEVEFHVFRLEDPGLLPQQSGQPGEPPRVSLTHRGYQLLSEDRSDQVHDLLSLLGKTLKDLELPLRSLEIELGPSQYELTLEPMAGMAAADAMVLLRSAIKQVCRRQGYLASFMARPALPHVVSSGWHLHQSLTTPNGQNAFAVPSDAPYPLSETGRQFLAGILAHAAGASVFTTPTINGYKRFQPFSLAPDRIAWGYDNRGAMIRVAGEAGNPSVHLENRTGEPAANPYLYMASQVVSGMDGISNQRDPGPPSPSPYDSNAKRLPANLAEALDALRQDPVFARELGVGEIDWLTRLKTFEWERFQAAVTDWEHREYFDLL